VDQGKLKVEIKQIFRTCHRYSE